MKLGTAGPNGAPGPRCGINLRFGERRVGLFLLICCYAIMDIMAICDHLWLKKAISYEFMRMG